MICSFDFCLSSRYYTDVQKNNLIDNLLENVKKSVDANGELTEIRGNIDNYRITILSEKIFFNGSLSKSFLISNVIDLSRKDIPVAIKELRKKVQMPIQYADVIRIDFAVNVFLKHKYKNYLPFFDETYGYTKGKDQYGGIKFGKTGSNQKIEIAIYDKLAELSNNARNVHKIAKESLDENDEKGIMRIEMRIKKLVRKTLLPSANRLLVAHLLSATVNRKIIKLWQKNYGAINKNLKLRLPTEIIGLKELKDFLAAKQIEEIGLNQVLMDIDEMALIGKWTSKKKSTTKSEIRKLSLVRFESSYPHYIIEIEKKINQHSSLSKWISDWCN